MLQCGGRPGRQASAKALGKGLFDMFKEWQGVQKSMSSRA